MQTRLLLLFLLQLVARSPASRCLNRRTYYRMGLWNLFRFILSPLHLSQVSSANAPYTLRCWAGSLSRLRSHLLFVLLYSYYSLHPQFWHTSGVCLQIATFSQSPTPTTLNTPSVTTTAGKPFPSVICPINTISEPVTRIFPPQRTHIPLASLRGVARLGRDARLIPLRPP